MSFGDIEEGAVGSSQKRFVYELLNPGDQDVVTFLTNGDAKVEIFAKTEKLKTNAVRPETTERGWPQWASIIAVLASALTTVFKFSIERVLKRPD